MKKYLNTMQENFQNILVYVLPITREKPYSHFKYYKKMPDYQFIILGKDWENFPY